jgi:hypothetical protein
MQGENSFLKADPNFPVAYHDQRKLEISIAKPESVNRSALLLVCSEIGMTSRLESILTN